jgi:hypothetical protein
MTDLRAVGGRPTSGSIVPSKTTDINDFIRRNGEAYLPHGRELLAHSARVEFIVPGAIPKGNIVIISGEPGAKKTWAAYSLMYAVASGTPWMGRGQPATQGPVVLLNYDNPTETVASRMRKLGFTSEMPWYVHSLGLTKPSGPNMPDILMLPQHESRLNYALKHVKPSLIVVDSFRQCNNLDENSNKEMASLMAIFKRWQQLNNTTVVLIHHTTKSKDGSEWKSSARGSGEIIASCDVAIRAEEDKILWTKHRTWAIGSTKEVAFELQDQYFDGEESPDGEIELIERVHVRAKTPLPGEIEAENIQKVVQTMKPGMYFQWNDIKKTTGFEEKTMRETMRNARLRGAVKFVKTPDGGKAYVLAA